MKHIEDIIKSRRSVRTFNGEKVNLSIIKDIIKFAQEHKNPYGIPVEFKVLNEKENGLSCPVVNGTDIYVGGKIKKIPHANEAFGYTFEMLVLYAQSLGIGTVWLGGTMNRSAYEKAMDLAADEMMPCATPLGYPSDKMSLKEIMMRKAIKANERLAFEELFYKNDFSSPLTKDEASDFLFPLEMVRLAPSAVNKQPWRVVITDNAAHFYLKRKNSGNSDSELVMQKVDMGIALCHFELAAKEIGLNLTFSLDKPEINTDNDLEYIASYIVQN